MSNWVDEDATVAFSYVNPDDPDRSKGLKPTTWNLDPHTGEPIHSDDERLRDGSGRYSVWFFAAEQTDTDEYTMSRKVAETNIKMQPGNRRDRRKNRGNIEMTTNAKMSAAMALISTMSRGWEGPEFIIPAEMRDPANRNNPHPLAGRLAPCNLFYMGKRHLVELHAVEMYLSDLYEPETEEEQNYFPGSNTSLDGPEAAGDGAVQPGNGRREVSLLAAD